ncbi:hypothetical protein [Clostridium saccharobutylicum]|uniref:Uncharacterized protein n=1 Tax=Clostridium saccharobutylicum TaxID=169679 RepID=A0A1S8MZ78_CLOSA|nr:hypothetical protein [Clostridium saccharobutylicum]OOM09455.1 hypothetical protein CLOSAC_37360 [Clostridium saccharobutylicum]
MVNEEILAIKEREFDLQVELFEREKEIQDKIEVAEIFGRMKEQVLIATNLIELGSLETDVIAEVTGLSITHVEALRSN